MEKFRASVHIVDESFQQEEAGQYHLFLQLGLHSLSLSVLDTSRNKVIALQVFPFQKIFNEQALTEAVGELLEQDDLLKLPYKQVILSCITHKSTLIPAPLYEADKLKTYFTFNHILNENEEVYSDFIKTIEGYNVFSFPVSLEKLLKEKFNNVHVHHFASGLIESLLLQHKNQNKKKLFVHVQPTHFEIIVTEGNKLLLFNSFQHQTSEDFVYYVLFVAEQLKLNPEEVELVLIGEVEKNAALYQILFKYIRHISFGKRPEGTEFSYKFDKIPGHFYYSLFSQHLLT